VQAELSFEIIFSRILALQSLGLFTILIRKLYDVRLLVALINLDAEDRRRGRRLFRLMLLYRVDHRMMRRRGSDCSPSLVESFGVGRVYLVLMSIDGIT
jgi:hypothetical protein